MAGKLILPDDRYEFPELFEPGRKPVCNVKIDVTSALANGLVEFIDMSSIRECFSFVTNKHYSKTGNITTNPDGISFGSNGYVTIPNSALLNSATGINQERTLIFLDLSFTTTGNTVISEKNANLHFVVQTLSSGITWRVSSNSGENLASSVINDGNTRNIALTFKPGTNGQKIYIDGNLDAERTPGLSAPADNANDLIIGSRSGAYTFPGNMNGIIIYNRVLTSAEVFNISSNPYQFLIPA